MVGRLAATVLVLVVSVAPQAGAAGTAPGAPGAVANWTEGDKAGFGGATSLASKVWFTLDDGELTSAGSGRSSPASAASTSSPPGGRPGDAWSPWPPPPTRAT
jgi:hypothetical protein